MSNAERILRALDAHLHQPVELTLYGRAALQLGFTNPPQDFAQSRDVDVVLWLGQAEELATASNFWDAVEAVNTELAEQELYITHLFEEDQVVLRPNWRQHRVTLGGNWKHLSLYRLGDLDLLLSKLMRDDPLDHTDARFIVERTQLSAEAIRTAIDVARLPDIAELREQFTRCSQKLLAELNR